MTTTLHPVDLWRDHQARYEVLPEAIDKGFEQARVELTPLEKHSVEGFVTILSDYVSHALGTEGEPKPTVEEWIEYVTVSLVEGWPVLSLCLAASNLDGLVSPSQDSRPYGILGQAIQHVIDQLTPIAEHTIPEVWKHYVEW